MFDKLKGRYSERKKNKERTVISYEDMPLDDYEQEKTEISPKAVKKIILGVVIALVVGLIVFAFANRDKLTWDNISVWWNYEVLGNAGKGYPVNLVGSEVNAQNFAINQGRVAYASDTSFVTLNSTGREVSNVQLRYTKPVMKAAENRFLTYGLGEQDFQVLNFDSSLYTGTADGSIYAGDIASNGRYCIVCEGNGYYSALYAYDKNNNQIFKYSFSEYYINSVTINKNGTGCVCGGISNTNGDLKTGVYVLDFSRENPLAVFEVGDDYILDSKYISNNRAVLVGGNTTYLVKTDDKAIETVDYDGKPLKNYCFNPSAHTFSLALSQSGDGRSCALITYNDNGEKQSEADSSYGCDSLSTYRGTIATLDGNTVYTYNNSGDLVYSCFVGTGAKRVLLSAEGEAFILSVNQVRKIDLSSQATPDSVKK